MNKNRLSVVILIALIIMLIPVAGSYAAEAKPIIIARIDLYSGPPAFLCAEAKKQIEMMAEEINKAGGLLGRPLKFLYRDVKNPEEAVRAARDMVTIDKVDVIMAAYSSAIVMALTDFAKQNKVLLMAHAGKSSRLTEELFHPYVFRTDNNTVMIGRTAAQFWSDRKLPYKKIITMGSDYEYGHKAIEEFLARLSVLVPDVKVIDQLWPPFANKDYAPYVAKVVGAKPDCLYTELWGSDFANFVKSGNAMNLWKQVPVVANHSYMADFVKPLGKQAPEGIWASTDPVWYFPDRPRDRAFIEKFESRFGHKPGSGPYIEGKAVMFLVEAIKKAGSTDAEKIIKALEGLKLDIPAQGPTLMRAYDHQASTGMVWGKTAWSDKYNTSWLVDCTYYPGDRFWHTEPEIKAIREKAGNKFLELTPDGHWIR